MIELKRVEFSERLSEETNAFAADVWFKGKKVGYAKNDGRGGCTWINCYPEQLELFKEAEEYAKKQPPIVYEGRGGMKGFEIDSNMENLVDRLFENWLEKKDLQKNQRKGIYHEQPNGRRATTYWKGHTIPKMLASQAGQAAIKKAVAKLQAEGCTILNTNLGDIIPELK